MILKPRNGGLSDRRLRIVATRCIASIIDGLFAMNDGPMLEQGIKAMHGKTMLMPDRAIERPDKDRLVARLKLYRAAN